MHVGESFEEFVIFHFPADPLILWNVGFDLLSDGEFIVHAKTSHEFEVLQVVLKYPLPPQSF